MRVRLKGIHRVTYRASDGTPRVYHYAWRGGPRLEGEPGTPQFMASYNAAIAAQRTPAPGELFALIAQYRQSDEFRRLAPRTRADYARHLKVIEERFGPFPLAGLSDPRTRGIFKRWRDEAASRSRRQADYAWVVLARVLAVAKDRGEIAVNPCERGGRLYQADRADRVWTAEDEAAFIAKAPAHLHLALLLALWTGQRQGDLLRLTWNQYDGQALRLRQGKTGRRVTVRVGEPLRHALDAERARKRGAHVLLTQDRRPWTPDGFRSSWRKACQRAGVAELTFHDLRGSAITRLAMVGCTVPEIAAVTGHSLRDVEQILDAHYLSRDRGLADAAIGKLEKIELQNTIKYKSNW